MSGDLRKENYIKWITTEGSELIKFSHPDADDFRYIRRKDFFNGVLTFMAFNYNDEQEVRKNGQNFIFDVDGTLTYYRSERDLVETMGASESSPGLLLKLLRIENVTGIFALVLLGVNIVWAFSRGEPPVLFASALTLVLGFYFGRSRFGQSLGSGS